MTHLRRRSLLLIAGLLIVAIGSVAAASAFFSGSGGGTGNGATGDTEPVQLSAASAAATLFPGGQTDLTLTVTNPNPGSVRVERLSLDTSQGTGGFAVDAAHSSCVLSVLSLATQTNGGSGWTIAAAGSTTVTLPDALSMGSGAVNGCQGADFTVYLKTSP